MGQWSDVRAANSAMERLQAGWQPLSFTVDRVVVITRGGFTEPFRARWSVPLGLNAAARSSPAPTAVDVPYVATVGGHPALPPPPPPPSLGLGELACWNFAYGANMAPEKLSGARGLTPLEVRVPLAPVLRFGLGKESRARFTLVQLQPLVLDAQSVVRVCAVQARRAETVPTVVHAPRRHG